MTTRSQSRYARDCEPLTATRAYYMKLARGESFSGRNTNNAFKNNLTDIRQEAMEFCNDMLNKIKEKGMQSGDFVTFRTVVSMKELLAKMEEKAKRAGIDPAKNYENLSGDKIQILSSIAEAKRIIQKAEASEKNMQGNM